jgi:hypothetical protein
MVGSRQVTQSVAKQLDMAAWEDLSPMGRVNLNDGTFAIGRRCSDGTLALANPPYWVTHGTGTLPEIDLPLPDEWEVFCCINHGGYMWSSISRNEGRGRLRFDVGPATRRRTVAISGCGVRFGECAKRCPVQEDIWLPPGVTPDENARAHLTDVLLPIFNELLWAKDYHKLPLIVLAGLR